jgi:hypothetical protein
MRPWFPSWPQECLPSCRRMSSSAADRARWSTVTAAERARCSGRRPTLHHPLMPPLMRARWSRPPGSPGVAGASRWPLCHGRQAGRAGDLPSGSRLVTHEVGKPSGTEAGTIAVDAHGHLFVIAVDGAEGDQGSPVSYRGAAAAGVQHAVLRVCRRWDCRRQIERGRVCIRS